jgi:uncharacterized membrane protein
LEYLDWLRGIAVLAMVHAHVLDSWTRDADRSRQAYYNLQWIGGVASPLFLFLAGVALAMSAAAKARQFGSVNLGAQAARRRGWEIFALAFVFRLQAELLGLGPLTSMLKVDMLNIMGLSLVIASLIWQKTPTSIRPLAFAGLAALMTFATPAIRAGSFLAPLPDPLEAYLRPAGNYAAFPVFPWSGFLFAGVLVGDLIDRWRVHDRKPQQLHAVIFIAGASGIALATWASYQPPLFPTANFWHDSPTIFFIRLGAVAVLVAGAWSVEGLTRRGLLPERSFRALVVLGRSSLFVYWIHIEFVYGVIAEPVKRTLPLWLDQSAWALMCVALYFVVLLKNRLLQGYELPRPVRIFSAVLR